MGPLLPAVRKSQALKIGYTSELNSLNYTINRLQADTQMFSQQFLDDARAKGNKIKAEISGLQQSLKIAKDNEYKLVTEDNKRSLGESYSVFNFSLGTTEELIHKLEADLNAKQETYNEIMKPVNEVDALNQAKEEKDILTQKLNKLAPIAVDNNGDFKKLCDYMDQLEAEASEHPEKLDNPSFKKSLEDARSQRDNYISQFEQDNSEQQDSPKTGDKLKLYI